METLHNFVRCQTSKLPLLSWKAYILVFIQWVDGRLKVIWKVYVFEKVLAEIGVSPSRVRQSLRPLRLREIIEEEEGLY